MDPLALLCTLHADGPRTLQRLRRAGCGDLTSLEDLGSEQVAGVLDWDDDRAGRFLREGGALAQRLGTGFLEPEPVREETIIPAASAAAVEEVHGGQQSDQVHPHAPAEEAAQSPPVLFQAVFGAGTGFAAASQEPGVEEAASAAVEACDTTRVSSDELGGGAGIAAILETWRELDRRHPPSAEDAEEAGEAAPTEAVESAGDDHNLHLLEGLPAAMADALQLAGIRSLAALAEAETMDLFHLTKIPFTRLSRFQFQAQNCLRVLAVTADGEIRTVQDDSLEAGGPFA